ncbi:MAG: hypothetical protein AAB262_15575 [Elusimicrobiota bacterium]
MSRALSVIVFAFGIGGCSWDRLPSGSTRDGESVRVSTLEPQAARRQALESVLPLFFSESARREKSVVLEEKIFVRVERFTGRERLVVRGEPIVEVRLDALAAGLEGAALLRPAGFATGSSKVLLALSESDGGYGIGTAADSLRRALVTRGVAAADARDPLNAKPFKAKTASEAVAEAAAGGVDWLLLGRTFTTVEPDAQAGAWRATARLEAELHATSGPSQPAAISSQASAVDVSSASALGQALEQAGAEAAASLAARLEKGRAGRGEFTVLSLPPRNAAKVRSLVAALRLIEGVESASLGAWRGPEDAASVRVFAVGLSVEELAARLLRQDPSLRLVGVEPEARQIMIETETEMGWGR